MIHSNAAPETDSESLYRFEVRARPEVLALLRALRDKRALITAYFDAGTQFLVTSIIDVQQDFEDLVLGLGKDLALNRRLLGASNIVFVGNLDNVKIQFETGRAEPLRSGGEQEFRVRIPEVLFRLQRRDHFRVPTPVVRPLVCSAPAPGRENTRVELTVLDISAGGIGASVDPAQLDAQGGQILKDCRMELPQIGTLEVTIEIRHVREFTRAGRRRLRLGCRFVALSGSAAAMLQRYVTRQERESLARR
ncbi:MAG: flagellar brake protein [Betaproteobacteria bacterium]|nr:flagellar brake protein [Betaproteobacteria bacterium]